FKEIGIKGTLHEFRRTKGSNLVAKGIEIEKVAKFLGHQNSSTTERYYVKNVESVVESLVNL
ncbi:MAG: tyrosine-type recombinase/integrase, partial [Candidatus Coprovivens sp.]